MSENETQRKNNAENPRYTRTKQGPQTQGRNRDLVNVTTRQKAEWPAPVSDEKGITEITVFCNFYAAVTTADLAAAREHIFGKLVIDGVSDAVVNALMTVLGTGVDDSGYLPIPLGKEVTVSTKEGNALSNGSLGGGRVDVMASDGTTPLFFWIGGN